MPSDRKRRDAKRAQRRVQREAQLHTRVGAPGPPQRQPNERQPFLCAHCGILVEPLPSGGRHRNHCPNCLYSLHVDTTAMGDRAAVCGGLMEPVATFTRLRGEQAIVHRCLRCGQERHNRIAADDRIAVLRELPVVAPRHTPRGTAADSLRHDPA